MARLFLLSGDGQRTAELRPVNSLGRHPNNSMQLLDKIVSKEHCIIELRGSIYVLRDLGSLNGTFINGERVKGEQALRHGDEIVLGGTRARFDDGSGAPLGGVPSPGLASPAHPVVAAPPAAPISGRSPAYSAPGVPIGSVATPFVPGGVPAVAAPHPGPGASAAFSQVLGRRV